MRILAGIALLLGAMHVHAAGQDAWLTYFDEYTRKRYGAMRTRDFLTWEDVSDAVRFPDGARHGTTLAVTRSVVDALAR